MENIAKTDENVTGELKIIKSEVEQEVKPPEVVKKKRGRKPKPKNPNEKKNTPKKRGRKKKKIDENEAPKVLKKRGRKPTTKIIDVKKVDVKTSDDQEESIIAHIPVKMSDIVLYNKKKKISTESNLNSSLTDISFESFSETFRDGNSDYDNKYIKHLEKENQLLKKELEEIREKINEKNKILVNNDYNIVTLNSKILTFDDENNVCFSKKTDSRCYWCHHTFDTVPFPLPREYKDGIFHVKNVFCSPNCARAYNAESKDGSHNIRKRDTLIFNLYNLMLNTKVDKINPAPHWEKLKAYDTGNQSIEDYRNSINQICNSRLIEPPMAPMKTLIEESYKERNQYKWENKDVRYDRYNKLKKNLKIKRSKPLKNKKNSLMKAMNIRTIKISD